MKVLVINAGSSSIKYQLIDMSNETVLAKGMCDRIGIAGGNFKHKVPGKDDYKFDVQMANHGEAIQIIVKALTDPEHGVINSMDEIKAVGHRVLHGGEKFSGSVIVNPDVIAAIEECCELGPLHNPHNLTGIRACEAIMPGVPQVAVFDTGFHQTMPDYAYLYALPYEYYEKYRIRRYGFHGTSHRYVSGRAAAMLGKDPKDTKIVTCHLGNGSSIAAVDGGKCFDTTMGLTPLEGIMMGTRCGSIDPAIVPLLMEKENLTPKEIDNIMNKKSGILGVSQKTSDNRDIEQAAKDGDERAILIENMICHQLVKYIGGFAAAMGGIDAIAFAGGIGENNPHYRARVAEKLAFLGVKIDAEKNAVRGKEIDISTPDSKIRMFVIPTDEELTIARDTLELTKDIVK
ncbi:MAG: acetate kinase [Clostridia bacterium]|nr:acetate kinase [Clostridia bacterium]MBQ7015318.1 acetate kinase [Clostridia bacterium]